MFRIKTLNKISPAGLSQLAPGKYTCGDGVEDPDAILLRSFSMHDMELPASLKAVARAGAGVNNIPIDKCSETGIVVFNTPGANANAVKELVLGAFIFTARHVPAAVEWAKKLQGSGDEIPKLVEKGKSQFAGPEIAGKTLGVIGLGAIGAGVANGASDLGMEVYGYDPYISVDAAWGLSRDVHRAASISEIYQKCDFITVHVPLLPDTRGMLNAEAFAGMKRGVRIFNFARGELVETQDILEALESGQVASYTTDFPNEQLLAGKNVVPVPHLGASTPESEDNCARMAAAELRDFLEDGTIRNSVNFPNVEMPRSTGLRVTVIHKNVPNMISQITATLSSRGFNIENLLNKSKKEYAYTMLDVAGEELDGALKDLQQIAGVVRVRVIR